MKVDLPTHTQSMLNANTVSNMIHAGQSRTKSPQFLTLVPPDGLITKPKMIPVLFLPSGSFDGLESTKCSVFASFSTLPPRKILSSKGHFDHYFNAVITVTMKKGRIRRLLPFRCSPF
jgi:hypothetical protein